MEIFNSNNGTNNEYQDFYNTKGPPLTENELEEKTIVKEKELIRLRKKKLQEEGEKLRKEQAIKSMKYLLSKSVKYSNFFQEKLQKYNIDPKTKRKKPLQEIKVEDWMDNNTVLHSNKKEKNTKDNTIDVTKQIKYFEGGTLRQYQIEGLTWMIVLFENGVNGILADEMGLGKTVQVIALICYLIQREIKGPFLIVAPLSTIPNWISEFKRFAPKIPVVLLHGNVYERNDQIRNILQREYKLEGKPVQPVVVTTYSVPFLVGNFFRSLKWQYVIVDEGHRLKNANSKLSQELRCLTTVNKLLLTGTPLQNSLIELWALLNFLLPHIFTDMDTFASLLMLEDVDNGKIVQEEEKNNVISTIHKVLAPFMLRRLKSDVMTDLVPKKEVLVYCPLTELQRDLYTYIIQKNIAKLRGQDNEVVDDEPKRKRACVLKKTSYVEKTENDVEDLFYEEFIKEEEALLKKNLNRERVHFIYRITLQNNMMMFKKVVDHPFLVHFPLDPTSKEKKLLVNEDIVTQSGKMLVLDAMLAKLKKKNHKVLIFSTLVMQLDIIEDYLIMRDYKYCRLDGQQKLSQRQENIEMFNKDPETFVFLISTRAGGLGLNLTAADTVILYDRDWNPQADIQAQDRCHRIGQKKPVVVYSLVTKNTIDEQIIHCGNLKRRLEKIVMQDGKFKSLKGDDKARAELDLEELQRLLNLSDYSQKIHSNGYVFSDEELEKLLDRSDLYKELEAMQLKELL
ncbi:lymphoid-specific helicase-like isoform X2 [Agrilus planipennis]|uniref:Proliferation-associated SNF2-like protein n=1 Tax=Agrilus planipennis TaxID=224129 RepID=A0A1W4XKH0_AGRPL|nr:lymphoid-specific helicase-like isoform X2 [Agrilus planipennis]